MAQGPDFLAAFSGALSAIHGVSFATLDRVLLATLCSLLLASWEA